MKVVYLFQISSFWQNFLNICSWIFLFMTFIEPSSMHEKSFEKYSKNYYNIFIIETIFLVIIILDLLLEFIHKYNDKTRNFKEKYYKTKKFFLRLILIKLIIADYLFYYIVYPEVYLRPASMLRPCIICFHFQLSF